MKENNKMKKLEEFISNNQVLFTKNLVGEEKIQEIESIIRVVIGPKLKEYILKYGFLCFEYIELYGINSKQGINSDMIKTTLMLHEQYPSTKRMIALENRGDGEYILVDEEDNTYKIDTSIDYNVRPLNKDLFDYIIDRFNEC